MSYGAFFNSTGGGGSIPNLDTSIEKIGFDAGAGTVVASAGANVKGTPIQLKAATDDPIAGFYLLPASASTAAARFLADLSFDGGATWAIENIFIQPGSTIYGVTGPLYFPMNIPDGANVYARVQAGNSGGSLRLAILGEKRAASSPPLFDICDALVEPDLAATYPGGDTIPLTGAWTDVADPTAEDYGAITANFGTAYAPALTQAVGLGVGLGAPGAEVEISASIGGVATANPYIRGATLPPVFKAIPAGSRLPLRAWAATPGSDLLLGQLFGFR